jgi:NAD(P)-dependent dehydrogenase (short-subunit alcohol dehydrogenase family)
MDLELMGKVAVVTAAGKGIGLAITRALAAEGALVVAGSREIDALDAIDGVTGVALDLRPRDAPAKLVQRALDEHGRLDILVNNIGAVRIRNGGFLGTSDEEFAWGMDMNFWIALRTIRAALPPIIEQGGGSIVNICSINATFQPDKLTVDYGAGKAALLNLSLSLAQEFGEQGVHVNCVSPGPVATDLWLGRGGVAESIAAGADGGLQTEDALAGARAAMATHRFTTPEEVATLTVMLASPRTANVTGANYLIDGGMVKTID